MKSAEKLRQSKVTLSLSFSNQTNRLSCIDCYVSHSAHFSANECILDVVFIHWIESNKSKQILQLETGNHIIMK